MKTRLIIIAVVQFISMSMSAQSLWDASKPDRNFTFGARAGVNFASTDMEYATSSRTGFHIGGTAEWNIVKSFSIETGISYITKGFKSDFGKGSSGYIQVPVLASYRIETPTGVQFHFNAGPYFSCGVSGSVKYTPYDETFIYNYDQNSFGKKGFFKRFDTGITVGAYIVLGHLLAGVSYEFGLKDIAKVYGKFHNRNVAITVGYNF